jgi:hypothetical protein
MLSLRDMQEGFAAALLNPGAHRNTPGVRADGVSPSVRLGFYRTNLFENYRKALRATYPAVEKLVGPGFFRVLAHEYARRFASRSGDVGRHAEHFAPFLSAHPSASSLPYLADVARLEWCIEESFNEADGAHLDLQRLAELPPEHYGSLRFLLAPSCRLLSSVFPIDRIWKLCQLDGETQSDVTLDAGRVDLLVRREGYDVTVESLTAPEFAMLSALASGHNCTEAFDYAHGLAAPFDAGAFLQRYVLCGVLVDFTLPAEIQAP